jgi:hypothetical protein
MAATASRVKAQARKLFKPAVARAVAREIDRAKAMPEVTTRRPAGASVISSRSSLTGWRGDRLYRDLGTGTFEGRISLIWNGPDLFVYNVDPNHPFQYTTAAGRVIRPQLMDTDGGSIPKLLRGVGNFSSWNYAPAFIIHDWLFVAHKCNSAPDNNWEFEETATVMAECIKTLMVRGFTDYDGANVKLPKDEDTLYAMYLAVGSRIARNAWNDPGSVTCRP